MVFKLKKIIPISILSLLIISVLSNNYNKIIIPKEAIRFRVIANSNSNYDQENKKIIAKTLSTDIVEILKENNSISEARKTLQNNLNRFEASAKEVAKTNNYKQEINIDYGNHYFPEKEYKGVTYKEGEYESLVVTLGKGDGDNFWCVLFPPLCLLEADESDTKEIEYKSFIKELIDKYF